MKTESFKLPRHTWRERLTDAAISVILTACTLGAIALFVFVFAATR